MTISQRMRMSTMFELDNSQSAYGTAKVAVLPVPYDGTATYRKGSRAGPAAIVEASQQVEDFDEDTGVLLSEIGIHLLPAIEPAADPFVVAEAVTAAAKRVLSDGKLLVTLGGEHAVVTAGACKAVMQSVHDIGVLVVDAHLDLRDEYKGAKYNHACTARRLIELGVEVVHVGARSWSYEEELFLRENSIEPVTAKALLSGTKTLADVVQRLPQKVYLSIDLDGLDPSVVPSVGTPEPGGLTWHTMLDLLKLVCDEREVVAADMVELAPIPGDVRGDFAAARLLAKFLSYRFSDLAK